MNPNVTFFYNQNESRGSTWQATVRVRRHQQGSTGSEIRVIRLYLYTGNGGASLPHIDPGQTFGDDQYGELLTQISEQVRPGLFLEEKADASGLDLICHFVGMEGRSKEALRLRPGYPATFVSFDKEIRLSLGGHLIVPIDVTARDRLRSLLDQLKWLSPDIESLVLNTIWRPGVDRRIEQIEKRLDIPQDVHLEPLSTWKKWWARGCRLGKEALEATLRYSPVFATVLLMILLAGNTQISWSAGVPEQPVIEEKRPVVERVRKSEKIVEATVDEESAATDLKTDEIGLSSNDEIAEQLKKLDETLSALAATSLEAVLYKSHFANEPATSVDALAGNEAFAWGFVKLVYLRVNGPTNVSGKGDGGNITTIVSSLEQRSWARVALERMLKSDLTKEQKAALALVTCQAFERDQAGLPGDSRPETDPNRDWKFQSIDMEQRCPLGGTDLVLAADGLRSLNDYLESLSRVEGN